MSAARDPRVHLDPRRVVSNLSLLRSAGPGPRRRRHRHPKGLFHELQTVELRDGRHRVLRSRVTNPPRPARRPALVAIHLGEFRLAEGLKHGLEIGVADVGVEVVHQKIARSSDGVRAGKRGGEGDGARERVLGGGVSDGGGGLFSFFACAHAAFFSASDAFTITTWFRRICPVVANAAGTEATSSNST